MLLCTDTLSMARLARGMGDVDGCESLSAAAVRQAEFDREYDVAFLAACVPARMFLRRCEPELAVAHYHNALVLAHTHNLTTRLPEANHDLYIAARDAGNESDSRRYFALATEAYLERRDPRIAGLLADRADARFTAAPSRETASAAVEHWRALPCTLPGEMECFFAGCNLMVSAAWLGWKRRYKEGLSLAEGALAALTCQEGVSAGLTDAATGALRAGEYPDAARLAESAVRIAVERGEAIVEGRAREVLAAALAERQGVKHI